MNPSDLLANSITKAIAYTENGGKVDIDNPVAGKTGEMKSIFQFTPGTWKLYAKQILGDENAPLNADNETYVVREKVKKWLAAGASPRQIAAMWNAGESEKDAHTGKFSTGKASVGVNQKYGVKFDVPGYANKVEKYVNEFTAGSTPSQASPESSGGPLEQVISIMKGAQSKESAPLVKKESPLKPQVGNGLVNNLLSLGKQPSGDSGETISPTALGSKPGIPKAKLVP
jgi:hypothetical protein